jgi:hypothetical protein
MRGGKEQEGDGRDEVFHERGSSYARRRLNDSRGRRACWPLTMDQILHSDEREHSPLVQQLSFLEQYLTELWIIDLLDWNRRVDSQGRGCSGALAEDHEDGFHAR